MAVRRMLPAGAVPITWLAVLGEWQRDWAREKTAAGVAASLRAWRCHGVALAWELQLLAGRPERVPEEVICPPLIANTYRYCLSLTVRLR